MPYTVIYYHMVWSTKYRQKTITNSIEKSIIESIQDKSGKLNSPIHAINTAYDHIHIAVTISPSIAIAEWVRHTKAFSSHIINREFTTLETPFYWQTGYGGKTFGQTAIPYVLSYVARQKEHHANNTLDDYLEDMPDD